LGKSAHEPLFLCARGRVHKNMEATRMPGQRTSRAASHQNAMPHLRGSENFLLNQLQHALRIEEMLIRRSRGEVGRVLPEDLAVSVIPGIKPLVELNRDLRIHSSHSRRARHKFRIQQPPPEMLGQVVCEFSPVRAVFPLNRYHRYRCAHHILGHSLRPPGGYYEAGSNVKRIWFESIKLQRLTVP